MYNMEISIGSYKVRLEIVAGIIVLFWVMFGHLLCGCCKVGLVEGFKSVINNPKNPNVDMNGPKLSAAMNKATRAQNEADRLQTIADDAQQQANNAQSEADKLQLELENLVKKK